MSSRRETSLASRPCLRCQRRCWLLGELSGPLDCCARDRTRLIELFALDDDRLLAALAGRRRAELEARHRSFTGTELCDAGGVGAVCRHERDYPRLLGGAGAPALLHVAGGCARLAELAAAPCVAIVGSSRPSDYGVQIAQGLARGLAGAGITVVAGLGEGIAGAARMGARAAGAGALAVSGTGFASGSPRPLRAQAPTHGCVLSELPCDCRGRRWGALASERIITGLASVTVVVEADASAGELAPARLARALGRTVAAVPGRVTSSLSLGTHALLIDGAELVRGPNDVLELLYPAGMADAPPAPPGPVLEPRLRETLAAVGRGYDTPDAFEHAGADPAEVLLALSELELLGLLARGDGGRYLALGDGWQ